MEEENFPKREEKKWKVVTRAAFLKELKKLSFLAAPMVAVTVSQYLMQVVSMIMVGHLGQFSISSVFIATSFTKVTGISPLVKFPDFPSICFIFFIIALAYISGESILMLQRRNSLDQSVRWRLCVDKLMDQSNIISLEPTLAHQ